MKYVIIGNSAAAIGCVEGIRGNDKQEEITLISKEEYFTYSRPLISYLANGKVKEENIWYRDKNFYEVNNCKLMLNSEAEKIDTNKKEVILKGGEKVSYDKLLIATGSRAFVPPIKGLDKVKECFTFYTLKDEKNLMASLSMDKKVLIVGAGLIGLKAAEGILGSCKKITVVDLAKRVLPNVLDEKASNIVKEHIEGKGIEFILDDSIDFFEENKATLKSGKEVSFDVLIMALGVRPNVEIAKEAGIEIDRAIVIDETCKTNNNDIYAAGDCTLSHDISSGENKILALLPNAYFQGECAGFNMAGAKKETLNAIPMNAAGFFGIHLVTCGNYDGNEIVKEENDVYKKFVTRDGKLVGFILINDINRSGIYTSIVRDEIPLKEINEDILFQKPQLMVFSKEKRKEMLSKS